MNSFVTAFLNSIIIHKEKTKEIKTVREIWKSDLNYQKN